MCVCSNSTSVSTRVCMCGDSTSVSSCMCVDPTSVCLCVCGDSTTVLLSTCVVRFYLRGYTRIPFPSFRNVRVRKSFTVTMEFAFPPPPSPARNIRPKRNISLLHCTEGATGIFIQLIGGPIKNMIVFPMVVVEVLC